MEKVSKFSSYYLVELIFLITSICIVTLIIISIFTFYDIRGVESNVIYSIQLAIKSNSLLYQSPENYPFNITQYSPLYYVVNDNLISALQIKNTEFYKIRIVTRLVSIVALTIALIYLKTILNIKLNIPKKTSLILCFLFLIISFPWFNISRPDVFVLLFFVSSIYCILSYIANDKKRKHAILLGVFLFFGLASKLTMGIYIVPFGIYMLISRKWRLLLISSVSFLFSFGLFYVLIWILNYDFTYLKENILDGINNGYDIYRALLKPYKTFVNYFSTFFIGLILLSFECLKKWKDEKKDSTLVFLITLNTIIIVLIFLAALKVGSAINYFNEALLCMIILAIYILEKHYKVHKKLYLIFIMIFGIGIALNHIAHYSPVFFIHNLKKQETANENASIKKYIDDHLNSNNFYSDNREIAMSFPDRCILFPHDIHRTTYRQKAYNYSLLEKWVNNKKLKYLIVYPGRNQIYGIDINKDYKLIKKYPHYYLYELTSYNNKNSERSEKPSIKFGVKASMQKSDL